MVCTSCQREFTPLSCPKCGKPLAASGRCPACTVGTQIACDGCGQMLEIAPAAPMGSSAAVQPAADVAPRAPQAMPGLPMRPPAAQGSYPVQPNVLYTGGQPQPHYTLPPTGQGQMPPPGYWYARQPYMPYLPTKVPLGGWFLAFYVLWFIGVVSTGIMVFSGLFSFAILASGTTQTAFLWFNTIFSFLNMIASFVFSLLIVININARNIRFKKIYHIQAVLGWAVSLYNILAMVFISQATAALSNSYFNFTVNGVSTVYYLLPSIISTLVSAGISVAWWIYFDRSRRVAYTCDPANNPGAR